MANESHLRRVTLFALRLICVTPFVLVFWWLSMPAYSWIVGHVAALVLRSGGYLIEDVVITAHGLLNTDTTLGFVVGGTTRTMPVSWVVTNVAVFVALVLVTQRLTWKGRLRAATIGFAVLAVTHVTHIVVFFAFSKAIARNPQVPTAIAQVFITLPFLLWIVLAYWRSGAPEAEGKGAAPPPRGSALDEAAKQAHD